MNTLTCYGRVASDVTTKDVNGRTVANFRFASQTKRKAQDNSGSYLTNFYNVAAWGTLGETAAKFLKKGHRACVSGDLVIRPYVGTDQQNHLSVELDANSIDFVETKAEAEAKAGNTQAPTPVAQPVSVSSFTPVEDLSDLPF